MGILYFFAFYIILICIRSYFGWGKNKDPESKDSLFDENNNMESYPGKSDLHIQIVYSYLAGWLIRKNTQNPKEKIQFIRMYFQRNFKELYEEAQTELINAMKYNTNIRSVSTWITKHLTNGPERIKIVDFLFEIAKVDGKIIDREFVAIVRLAELIGVRAEYIEKKMKEFADEQFRSYQNQPKNSEYSKSRYVIVLQLPENYTPEQLKRAYRKMAKRYHPDAQLALSADERKAANEKFLQIQEAYEYLSELK